MPSWRVRLPVDSIATWQWRLLSLVDKLPLALPAAAERLVPGRIVEEHVLDSAAVDWPPYQRTITTIERL